MAKQSTANGFTLKEMLIVLLILCMLSRVSIPRYDPLSLGMKKIQEACLQAQMQAYITKTKVPIEISRSEAYFGQLWMKFDQFVCEPYAFHYNEKGNISKGGRLFCSAGQNQKSIVFQIGMGRMRIE